MAALAALSVLLLVPAVWASPAPAAGRRTSATLAEPRYAGPLAAGTRAALGAPKPGSGGWFWPIGTEQFQGWSGFLDKRGSYVHVAQDMPCAVGHPVYAISDGVVFISRADAGGYGVGGAPGGCIIITHVTASGVKFHALYGHVSGLKVKEGQRVSAGQVIAAVNGCRHLHFSTHIGFKYRDGNPYAGHVPSTWTDHGGYVDPVKFLKANPRAAAYKPPALPVVEVTTQPGPQRYGAAAGAAYWTEEGGAGSVTWRQDLASGQRQTLGAADVVPPFDTARYHVELLASPASGFSVSDHLPALTLRAGHDTPPWGRDAELDAVLLNATGAPFQGGVVKLQRRSGDAWRNVQLDVTGADGAASFAFSAAATTLLRVVFTPPATQPAGREYLVARTRALTITPHVALTVPKTRPVVDREALVTVTGSLTPGHPVGERTVQLVFQRRGASGWVAKLTAGAVNRAVEGSTATRYVGHARLTAGSWRVQAVHPADAEHAATATAWRTFSVR